MLQSWKRKINRFAQSTDSVIPLIGVTLADGRWGMEVTDRRTRAPFPERGK